MDCAKTHTPITYYLRRRWELHMRLMADEEMRERFGELCDAIDARHAALEAENAGLRERVRNQRKQLTETQDALERRNNGELKRRWQRELDKLRREFEDYKARSKELLLDADKVPVRVGDTLGWPDGSGTFEVIGIGDSGTLFYVNDDENIEWTNVTGKHHVEPDTWERIIEDALGSRYSAPDELSDDFVALVARCKALANERS